MGAHIPRKRKENGSLPMLPLNKTEKPGGDATMIHEWHGWPRWTGSGTRFACQMQIIKQNNVKPSRTPTVGLCGTKNVWCLSSLLKRLAAETRPHNIDCEWSNKRTILTMEPGPKGPIKSEASKRGTRLLKICKALKGKNNVYCDSWVPGFVLKYL